MRIIWTALFICSVVIVWFFLKLPGHASGHEDSPLHAWFDALASKKGLCCSFADGFKIDDVDWQTKDGHYQVRLEGKWVDVPDDAVITVPNKFGPAVVWPVYSTYPDGHKELSFIRCFMPGAGT